MPIRKLGPSHIRFVRKGQSGTDSTPPQYSTSEVGDVNYTTIEVLFSENVESVGGYELGVTIRVNAVAATINSATRQGNERLVYYVIAAPVDVNDVVTWEYDSGPGDIQDQNGNDLGDVAAETVTNYVGSHLYFDTEDDAVHWAYL